MKCTKCGFDGHSAEARFCRECGNPMDREPLFASSVGEPLAVSDCPNCGLDNKVGAKFCRGCGTTLGLLAPSKLPERVPDDTPKQVDLSLSCPACGVSNPTGRRFCKACGQAMPGTTSAAVFEPAPSVLPAEPEPAPVEDVAFSAEHPVPPERSASPTPHPRTAPLSDTPSLTPAPRSNRPLIIMGALVLAFVLIGVGAIYLYQRSSPNVEPILAGESVTEQESMPEMPQHVESLPEPLVPVEPESEPFSYPADRETDLYPSQAEPHSVPEINSQAIRHPARSQTPPSPASETEHPANRPQASGAPARSQAPPSPAVEPVLPATRQQTAESSSKSPAPPGPVDPPLPPAQPAPTPSRPVSLAELFSRECSGLSGLKRTVCQERVRFVFCNGKWGTTPECPKYEQQDPFSSY